MAQGKLEGAALNSLKRLNQIFTTCLMAGVLISLNTVAASEEATSKAAITAVESGELYLPSEDAQADIERAVATAREQDQLVLVVFGANWCHDSRALAARIYQEPLDAVINRHYQVVFVDVAFLEDGRDVISSIGPPVYYATPTVLILDPVSGLLVNSENRHQWGNADSISMGDTLEYFQLMANVGLAGLREGETQTAELQELLADIDAFELEQAERLYAAYAVIGPMLSAYKNGEEPEHFEIYWNEVREFRMKVPHDIDELRSTAKGRISKGEKGITLDYPQYPAFSWEEGRP